MRRIIYISTSAVATIAFGTMGLLYLYGQMTQKGPFPGVERFLGWTAIGAMIISLVAQARSMNPTSRQTIRRIILIQIGTGLFAGLGILTMLLAGTDSSIGRAAIYATLAIAVLGASFAMAYGYSLPWTAQDRAVSRTAVKHDPTSKSK
jgi:hypothetical protein